MNSLQSSTRACCLKLSERRRADPNYLTVMLAVIHGFINAHGLK
jgi:hypothetical protein